jgi:pimeloyl-ACP methyl ester carboxylesterase
MKTQLYILAFIVLLSGSVFAQDIPSFITREIGSGTTHVILIPGFSCSGDVWDDLVAKFKDRYTFHVVTFAGFAGVQPQQNPSVKNWSDDLVRYVREKKLDHPILLGHSMGGIMSMELAAEYPRMFAKVIVVDALPCISALQNPSFKVNENLDCSPMVAQFVSISNQQFYTMQKNSMYSMVADTSKIEKIVGWSVKSDRATLAKIFCQLTNLDLREKIAAIECPSLILLEPSFKNMPAVAEQFRNLTAKQGQIHYATKGLHFIMYDDKDWFLNEVDAFISK